MTKHIFDGFTFFNEIELLKLRLNELYDSVDFFVLCESTKTFQGKPKPLYFEENKSVFSSFLGKIIHVVVDDMPESSDPWVREHFQRNAIRRGLKNLSPDDIVIVSDVDEIPRQEAVRRLRDQDGFFLLEIPMYQFFINTRASSSWNKVFAFSYALIEQVPDFNKIRVRPDLTFKLLGDKSHLITEAGWHFTFLGGAEKVREKLGAYSHTGGHYELMRSPGAVETQMEVGYVVGGGKLVEWCEIDDTFPAFVRQNLDYYRRLGVIKESKTRIREMERALGALDVRLRATENHYREVLGELSALTQSAVALLSPYVLPEHKAATLRGKNLIKASSKFGTGWSGGTQPQRARETDAVPYVVLGNKVVAHERGDSLARADNNVGWWKLADLLPEVPYTASCWIWVPSSFVGERINLHLEGFANATAKGAELLVRDCWQRIWTTAICPPDRSSVNLVLRVDAAAGALLYSTCWQMELGRKVGPYKATPEST